MKLAANVSGLETLRAIVRLERGLSAAALDAATDALVREAERAREAAGLAGSLTREGTARRRLIGSRDPAAVARELGALDRPPAPWLAPAAAAALARMRREAAARRGGARAGLRAAAMNAIARALSRLIKS
jgi:hypothetical protein